MTMQARDIISVDEEKFALEAGIFEPFFKANPERRPKPKMLMSNLWRKYIAYLKLSDNELLVYKIAIPNSKINEKGKRTRFYDAIDLSKVFLKKGEESLLFFNGFIVFYFYPSRKYWKAQLRSLPLEFLTIEKPEKFKILHFEKGKLTKSKTCNTEEITAFKDRQFNEFKKSKIYSDMLNEKLNWYKKEDNPEMVFNREQFDNRIYHHILEYTEKFL